MSSILRAYQRRLNPVVLVFLLFLFLVGMIVMRHLASKIAVYNEVILDLRMGYSFQECQTFILGLTEDGRSLYENFFYVDLVYMFIYNTFYFSTLLFLFGKIGLKRSRFILLFPLFSFVFDLGENLFIKQMIKNFYTIPQSLCHVSSTFTVLKFVCTYSSLAFCCLLTALLIKKRIQALQGGCL